MIDSAIEDLDINVITDEEAQSLSDWACGINQPQRYPKSMAQRLRERLDDQAGNIASGVTKWVG